MTVPREIDIVFDGPPDAVSGRFVEVEDSVTGASVDAGTWIDRGNGLWALRIGTGGDIAEILDDLQQRMAAASENLSQIVKSGLAPHEAVRLRGKIEGIELARTYVLEQAQQFVQLRRGEARTAETPPSGVSVPPKPSEGHTEADICTQ